MMAQFSPFTRRLVAVGILILGLFALVNLLIRPIYGLTADSLSGLNDARFHRARLEAIAKRPPLPRAEPVPPTLYLSAPDREKAQDALVAAIGGSAAAYEIRVENVSPLPADPARPKAIAVAFRATGAQDQMLAWINSLEFGPPAVHFAEWSLAQVGEAAASAAPPAPAAPVPPPAGAAGEPVAMPPVGVVQLALDGTAVAIWEKTR